jgi:hypothetical protein
MIYYEYEMEAMNKILDAVTMGMCAIASASGCSTRDAAMARLQKVLDALNSVYPDALHDDIESN